MKKLLGIVVLGLTILFPFKVHSDIEPLKVRLFECVSKKSKTRHDNLFIFISEGDKEGITISSTELKVEVRKFRVNLGLSEVWIHMKDFEYSYRIDRTNGNLTRFIIGSRENLGKCKKFNSDIEVISFLQKKVDENIKNKKGKNIF